MVCFIKNYRFRQDGIEKNPTVLEQSGVLPYRTAGQAQKYAQILKFIPQKLIAVPYNIISDIERVSLTKNSSYVIQM